MVGAFVGTKAQLGEGVNVVFWAVDDHHYLVDEFGFLGL